MKKLGKKTNARRESIEAYSCSSCYCGSCSCTCDCSVSSNVTNNVATNTGANNYASQGNNKLYANVAWGY